jgi:WD40 repeat protein
MPWMNKEKFLQEYELELNKEFACNGVEAAWANDTSAHRFWGSEDASFTLRDNDPRQGDGAWGRDEGEAGLSPDGRFLAVATNAVIRIYNVQSQEVRGELIGHQKNVSQLFFAPGCASKSSADGSRVDGKEEKYRLFSCTQDRGDETQIIAWSLDGEGKQPQPTMPFAIQDMADRAIAAISSDLSTHHSLSDGDIEAVRAGFSGTLQVADTKNRSKNLPHWSGKFPSFGSYPISPDGQAVLFVAHGETTQHGMRPADKLPQIVVVDLATQSERCRLNGHTDAIMWAGWSPDGKTIATACWDQHYKIWDAHTGQCRHTIGPTNGQNWAGAFSPDGKYILLSGGREVKVAIYGVETGEEIAELKSEGLKLEHWIRYFAWNPAGECIALVNGKEIVLWHPFEDKVETIFKVKTDGTMLTKYNGFSIIKWAQGGKKLLLQDTAHTTYVWDREKNVKWRFQRPQGMALELSGRDVFYVDESEMVVSLDGDRKVRYWKL